MANKQKKKRNKPYRGVDAAIDKPVITRIAAVNRNPVSQWWFDHKRIAKPVLIASAVILVVAYLIFELIRISTNG
jgi:hypothetical protein